MNYSFYGACEIYIHDYYILEEVKSNSEGYAHLLSVCINQTHLSNTWLTIFTGIYKIFHSNPSHTFCHNSSFFYVSVTRSRSRTSLFTPSAFGHSYTLISLQPYKTY